MAEHAATADEVTDPPDEEDEHDAATDEGADGDAGAGTGEPGETVAVAATRSPRRAALVVGLSIMVALGVTAGWLGYRTYGLYRTDQQRTMFVEAARQGAVDLTTIDWQRADADVQRILDSATGTFLEDFQRRSQPFLQVVEKAQSKSVGTVTAAAFESATDDQAKVLVAVSVSTSTGAAPAEAPRAWRMRITVQRLGDEIKVANVEFVP